MIRTTNMTTTDMKKTNGTGKLYGVGVGPGDPELMTLKGLRIIRESDVIAIPGEHTEKSIAYKIAKGAYPEIDEKELLPVPTPMTKDKSLLEANYRKCADSIERALDQGKDVALLTLGDPTVYSTYIYIHRMVLADGYSAGIISGVTSFCAASAEINDSLVDRQEMLHVIPASYQVEESLTYSGTKILMKAGSKLADVKEVLRKNGSQAVMVENCGMEEQRIYSSVEEIPDHASYYSLLIVKD